MLCRLILAGFVIVGLTAWAPAPRPKPAKKTEPKDLLQALQGDWEMVSLERNLGGGGGTTTSRSTSRIRVQGNKWSYVYNTGGAERISTTYDIRLDPSAKPAHMDLLRSTVSSLTLSGIVTVEGDQIKFCYKTNSAAIRRIAVINPAAGGGAVPAPVVQPADRPTAFNPVPENCILMTLKRVGPAPTVNAAQGQQQQQQIQQLQQPGAIVPQPGVIIQPRIRNVKQR